MRRIGIISDTHALFDEALQLFLSEVDEVWHAGDIGGAGVPLLDSMREFKPMRAVFGNIDGGDIRRELQQFECFECEGVRVLMTHIGGYPKRYTAEAEAKIKLLRPKLFISGHSHILKVIYDPKYDLLHINPGAAGSYGFHKLRTAVRLTIDGEEMRDLEVWEHSKLCFA